MNINLSKRFFLFLLLSIFSIILKAQKASDTLNRPVPVDPHLVKGTLKNGFTYYILPKASTRVFIGFVIKVGYNNETEDQQELAHLLEHLPFNQTKHFNNPREFFVSHGLNFGLDFNAQTSADNTRFFAEIPAGNIPLFDSSLLYFRDCAHDFNMSDRNIDIERGVILGEMRRSTSETSNMRNEFLKDVVPINGFSNRNDSTRKANVESFKYETLINFFNQYYTPDNQAIVIVGNVNTDSVIKKIEILFNDLKNTKEKKRKVEVARFKAGTQIIYASHPKMLQHEIQIRIKVPYNVTRTYIDVQNEIIQQLYEALCAERFDRLKMNNPDCRFFSSYKQKFDGVGPTFSEIYTASICDSSSDMYSRFKQVWTELFRIQKHGFSAREIEIAKKAVLKKIETKSSPHINFIADYITSYFVEGTAFPGDENLRIIQKKLLSTLSDIQINTAINRWLNSKFVDIVFLYPSNGNKTTPTESIVRKWFSTLSRGSISALNDSIFSNVNDSLLIEIPQKSNVMRDEIIKIDTFKGIDLKKFWLRNGITLLTKNITEGSRDEIVIQGVAPGSPRHIDDKDYCLSIFSAPVAVVESGIANLDGPALQKYMEKKNIILFPFYDRNYAGIFSSIPSAEFIPGLEILYGFLRQPRIDSAVLSRVVLNSEQEKLKTGKPSSSQVEYNNRIRELTNIDNDEFCAGNKKPLIDGRLLLENYKTNFLNTRNLNFIVTGKFDESVVVPKVIEMLSGIAANGVAQKADMINYRPNKHIRDTTFLGTVKDKASVHIKIYDHFKYSIGETIKLDLLQILLTKKLTEKLRHELGGTYHVMVHMNYNRQNDGFFTCTIMFECDPARIEELKQAALGVLEKAKDQKLINDNLSFLKKTAAYELKGVFKDAGFWVDYLKNQILYQHDLAEIENYESVLQVLSTDDILDGFNKFLAPDNISVFQLMPESFK